MSTGIPRRLQLGAGKHTGPSSTTGTQSGPRRQADASSSASVHFIVTLLARVAGANGENSPRTTSTWTCSCPFPPCTPGGGGAAGDRGPSPVLVKASHARVQGEIIVCHRHCREHRMLSKSAHWWKGCGDARWEGVARELTKR